MALRRRSDRTSGSLIWPGFVDAMTALLLVLMFVLSIFMIVQFILREELTGKDRSLQELSSQLGLLTSQLFTAEAQADAYQEELKALNQLLVDERAQAEALAAALNEKSQENAELSSELSARVNQLAALASALKQPNASGDELAAIAAALAEDNETLKTRIGSVESVEEENEALKSQVAEIRERLEKARQEAETKALTLEERVAALELALDKKEAEAEQTLLLLAAAEQKQRELDEASIEAAKKLSQEEKAAAFARAALQSQTELSAQSRKAVALLNSQVRRLREQIAALNAQLDTAEAKDAENQVIIQNLGQRLNQALAQKVSELQRYRSEFFGRMREVLGDRQDIQIVGDRFVFQSEVLFDSGSAELGDAGKSELSKFAGVLREIADKIPGEINWILRVDGHTDIVPLGPSSPYEDNWELSQARALSVVKFLLEEERLPPDHLAATGFGQYQPIATGRSAEALARNRRIELKLTER